MLLKQHLQRRAVASLEACEYVVKMWVSHPFGIFGYQGFLMSKSKRKDKIFVLICRAIAISCVFYSTKTERI